MLPLVCIDVDGTLIGSSRIPTDAVWEAAATAVAQGQHLSLSTGRGAFGVTLDYARRLHADGWHIFHNGAAIVHARSGKQQVIELAPAVIEQADEAAQRNGWVVEYYSAGDYTVDSSADLAVEHAAMLGVPHVVRERASLSEPIVRLQFVVPVELIPWVRSEMAGTDTLIEPATSPMMRGTAFVSVTGPGASKAAAIERLAAELGTSTAHTMMVGDSHNDVQAIATVGHGVAMGNAAPEAKAVARHVVAHVDDDGLVEALAIAARA